MSAFADEARTRAARLLQMAGDDEERARILDYTAATPEPPPQGSHGIATRGCPLCRRTMWRQEDRNGPVWVCAGCGHVETGHAADRPAG